MYRSHDVKLSSMCETDFIVLGSGVAGLRAALELCHEGRVLVVAKGGPHESSSLYAQGGVAVALSEEDHANLHFADTVKAGDQLCRKAATKTLVEEGPDRIAELIEWGAQFDKINGKLAFAKEGAHSCHRVLRAGGDATGMEMVRVLTAYARQQPNIRWMGGHFSLDLFIRDNRCFGAIILNETTGELRLIIASAVILATGGAGQVYARTTNPSSATGDGMAMALRAGATLEDMEFVQYHPTALYLPSTPPFLLSETMRGEGGLLRNIEGDLFMKRYHEAGELASRDVVARAIWSEMLSTKSRHVYLDVTHLGASFVKKRFPTIYSTCLRYDIDITEEWIPTSPSAHYFMGGVKTDLGGQTTVPGLFAAGEVACSGVHGANRLASNSLLEGLVFGFRAAQSAISLASRHICPIPRKALAQECRVPTCQSLQDTEKLRNSLRRLMWAKVGLVRRGNALERAISQLSRWEDLYLHPRLARSDLEVRNLIQVGRCIAEAALWRKNSLGAHYRADFPNRTGPHWRAHSHSLRSGQDEPFSTPSIQAG